LAGGKTAKMQRFQELKVWQRSHALVLEIYRLTTKFPPIERYSLVAQLRTAALSVPTNIAEGSKRLSNQEYARFLNIAEGSLAETEYLLTVSQDLGYLSPAASKDRIAEASEIARMLHSLGVKVEQGA
jgi:four helix bundle protein